MNPSKSATKLEFENGQVRIVRVVCAAGERRPASEHPGDPAVVVMMSGAHRGEIRWSPAAGTGPVEQVRVELKSKPAPQAH